MIEKNALSMKITVTNCQYNRPKSKTVVAETNPASNNVDMLSNMAIKTYQDFNEVSKSLNPDVDIKILDKDSKMPEKVECPTCHGTTYQDDIRCCTKNGCTNLACSNCGTLTEKGFVCSTCWESE